MSNESTPSTITNSTIVWRSRWQTAIQQEIDRCIENNVFTQVNITPFPDQLRFHFVPKKRGIKARLVLLSETEFADLADYRKRLEKIRKRQQRYRRAQTFLLEAFHILDSCDKKSLTYRTIVAWIVKTTRLAKENPHISFWKIFSDLPDLSQAEQLDSDLGFDIPDLTLNFENID